MEGGYSFYANDSLFRNDKPDLSDDCCMDGNLFYCRAIFVARVTGGANANSDWLLREGDIGNICVTFLLFVDRIKIVPIFLFAVSGCL